MFPQSTTAWDMSTHCDSIQSNQHQSLCSLQLFSSIIISISLISISSSINHQQYLFDLKKLQRYLIFMVVFWLQLKFGLSPLHSLPHQYSQPQAGDIDPDQWLEQVPQLVTPQADNLYHHQQQQASVNPYQLQPGNMQNQQLQSPFFSDDSYFCLEVFGSLQQGSLPYYYPQPGDIDHHQLLQTDTWFEQLPQLGTPQADHLYKQQQASANAYQPQPGYMQQEQQQQQVVSASSLPISPATTQSLVSNQYAHPTIPLTTNH